MNVVVACVEYGHDFLIRPRSLGRVLPSIVPNLGYLRAACVAGTQAQDITNRLTGHEGS